MRPAPLLPALLAPALLAVACAAVLPACSSLPAVQAALLNRVALDERDLQGYLDQRFPQDYEQLGGLLTLTVLQPNVRIPDAGNRLHIDFDVGLQGVGIGDDAPDGHFAITSGLRFDLAAQALYLEDPRLESAQLPMIGSRMNATGRELINGWLRDWARREPIYRLDADRRAQLGNRRVSGTLIEDGKVVVKLDD